MDSSPGIPPGCSAAVDPAARRTAHVLLGAFVAFAAAGLFGGGPWPLASAREGDVSVRYARVLHAGEPSTLEVRVAHVDAPALVVELGAATQRKLILERTSPPALREHGTAEGTRMEFAARAGQDAEVELRVRAESAGWQQSILHVPPQRLVLHQLVLP